MTREVLENIKKTACNRRPRGRGRGRETESTARERGLTDIALCCTLFDGMMRINEALDLCRSDIRYDPDGRSGTAVIRGSKTDQEGRGAVQWLSVDTMAALEAIRPPDAQPEDKIFTMSDVDGGAAHREGRICGGAESQAHRTLRSCRDDAGTRQGRYPHGSNTEGWKVVERPDGRTLQPQYRPRQRAGWRSTTGVIRKRKSLRRP